MSCTATLVGASGLIGTELLSLLLKDPYFSVIKIVVRKSTGIKDPKLQECLVDFTDKKALEDVVAGSSIVFCSVGTTRAKVKGDKAAYRKVDYDIPVAAARAANLHHASHFILVSAIGARSKSNNFYLQLKGEVEDLVETQSSISGKHIFQPSLLLGSRKESRPGEKLGQVLMPFFSFLLMGSLKKYRAISSVDMAKAMLAVAKTSQAGIYRYTYSEIENLACQPI